jgi:poly(hydroxyalkanoate) depolymerase family esterase
MPKKRSTTASLVRSQSRSMGRLTQSAMRVGKQFTRSWAQAAGVPSLNSNRPPAGQGRWLPGVAMGPGGARQYALFVPHTLDRIRREPAPLMVMLHGCGQSAAEFAQVTRMNELAASEGFLVLYPQQDVLHNGKNCWNWWDTQLGSAQAEAATLMQAIQQVSLTHGVDRERVAIAGLSAGGSMAALMGAIYLDRFCAVAMHSGVAPGAARSGFTALAAMQGHRSQDVAVTAVGKAESAAARHRRLPPMLVLQGDADLVVRRSNGEQAADLWAQISGARARLPRQLQRGQRLPWRQTDFVAGGELSVRLCEIEGLGHAWSGGRARHAFSDPSGPNATRMIWRFAQAAVRRSALRQAA